MLVEYVFELPTMTVYKLSELLDPENLWETVALAMPQIQLNDVASCRRCAKPTEALIRIWGSKGYKVLDLYKVFGRIKYVTCMRLLHPYIDSNLHHYTNMVVQKNVLFLPKTTEPNNEGLSVGRNTDHTQPSLSVYKSTKNSDRADWLLDSEGETTSASSDMLASLKNTPVVKYDDIRAATNNFDPERVCGRGGYGVVYRGIWQHTEVAIKRIRPHKSGSESQIKERIRQSLQELRHLSKLRHDNILSLYAYSMDGLEPCLIYQFMSNGSLEDRILCRNDTPPLNWEKRKLICLGASRGLHFLHTIDIRPIIHGDVKCANILLDKYLDPKIGDFGLCRDGQVELGAPEKSPMIASHIKGTLAYLPPEFTRSKILTTKLDVYSFGVVLLEVATGLRAYSDQRQPHSLVSFVNNTIGADKMLSSKVTESLSDKRLQHNDDTEIVFKLLLEQGICCSGDDFRFRPSFAEIVSALT